MVIGGKEGTDKRSRLKVIVGLPAYNEAKYLGSVVVQAKQYADEVIVVDDGSIDGTSKVAQLSGATVVKHAKNQGYGAAIRTIISQARERGTDILVTIDADSQHNPDEIPVLIKAIVDGSDVVIGTRKAPKNQIAPYRRLGQNILAWLTSFASKKKMMDTESGFRAYSGKAILTLDLKEQGMAISSEIVYESVTKGLKVTEVPISVSYTKDSSTLNPVVHGVGVLSRILVMISERRPLLFFVSVGGVFLLLGFVAGGLVIWNYYVRQNSTFMPGTALVSMLFVTIGLLTIYTGVILNILVNRLNKRF